MARPSLEEPEEREPLLAERLSPEDPRNLYRRTVVILGALGLFTLCAGAGLLTPAMTAVMEDRICREAHPEIDDYLRQSEGPNVCQSPEVQGRLAMLRGWGLMLDCIPPVLTAIPYGLLADKWGRKRVLVLSFFGFILATAFQFVVLYFDNIFPIDTILISFVFMFIGGSPAVSSAMLYTLVADVAPVAARATIYFQLAAVSFLSDIIANPIAGLIMMKSNWAALLTAMAVFILAIVEVSFIPETLELVKLAKQSTAEDTESDEDTTQQPASNGLVAAWDFLRANGHIAGLIISLVFTVLGRFVQEMLLQYTAKRYHWTWSEATFLLTIRSVMTLAVLSILLPAASHLLLVKMEWSGIKKDLWLARISGAAGICGSLLIGFAFKPYILVLGLIVFSLSGGMTSLVRSLCNSLVTPEHTGMLNTLVVLGETIGIIVAAPALSQSLKLGLTMGGAWIGLPFICAAVIMTVSTSIVWLFRIPPTHT